MMELVSACRSCGSPDLETVLSLGTIALADNLLTDESLKHEEPKFPLDVIFCGECSLVQLRQVVSPDAMFGETYQYFSSFSDALLEHSRKNAERLIESRKLGSESLVLELASNDGYMLQFFAGAGVSVLGIDPAPGPAEAARAAGIPTHEVFFTEDYAAGLRKEGTAADVVIANNVLAHVPDLNGFIAGIKTILKDDGVVVIEAPYVKDLVDHCEFDTIYHEHLCYFSVTAVSRLFEKHGLYLNHVEHYPIHGGSLRYYLEPTSNVGESVRSYLRDESECGLTKVDYYADFATRVGEIKRSLLDLMQRLKREGNRIAGYGAAAKGTTLLNYTGLGTDFIDFVVDRNTHKQGRYMPGVHIPIGDPSLLLTERPDYVLLLAWNFKDEIFAQQAEYRQQGGKFIVPVPSPDVM